MRWTLPEPREREEFALLLMRTVVGSFLVWGVWDNIIDEAHMATFVAFLGDHGFPVPEVAARLSVVAQFSCGVAFLSGAFVRWAGLLCAANFIVAIAMVDYKLGLRGMFPAASLVAIGLYLAARGGGRFALDARLERRR